MNLAIVVTYFGKLPVLTPFWLKSCSCNTEITFYLITNDKKPNHCPNNVIYVHMELKEFQDRVKDKLSIEIDFEGRAYKTCDFRPLYGVIFDDYLNDYEYFGQCELDMIFGDLSSFINDELLRKYKKLFSYGHLTIYKNDSFLADNLDVRFGGGCTYRELLEKEYLCNSDEQFHPYSVNLLYDEIGEKVYENANKYIGDVAQEYFRFVLWDHSQRKSIERKGDRTIFEWNNGKLFGYCLKGNQIQKKEYIYVHLQKRSIEDTINLEKNYSDITCFLIVPNKIIRECNIDMTTIKKYSPSKLYKQYFVTHKNGLMLRLTRLVKRNPITWDVGTYKRKSKHH